MKARLRKTADGAAFLVIPKEGPSIVITNKAKQQMEAVSLPTSISDAIRARRGPAFIEVFKENGDLAVLVMIEGYTLAYCTPKTAQRLLIRQPKELFLA